MTFDPLTIGQMKRPPWRLYNGWPIQHIGSGSFLILSYSTFDLSKKQIWTFLTFDPLTTGRMKRLPWTLFDGWPKPTYWHSQICWRRLLKIWLSTVTPRWPPIKNSWTPRKNLWPSIYSPKFHQNLLNHVDEEAFWAYLNNDPKWPLNDIWLQIPEPPYLSPYLMIIVSKYHENPSRHIREEAFSNCERTDRYTDRYTDTSVCHKLIAPMVHELKIWWGEQETPTQLLQNQDASSQSAQERRPDESNRSSSTSIWSWRRRWVLIKTNVRPSRWKTRWPDCGPTFCLRSECHLRPFHDLLPSCI